MLQLNKVMLAGRLTRDPETKYLPSGQAVTTVGLAVNRRYPDRNGEWKDETMFIDVETWGKTAERVAEAFRKGNPVFVEGRLKQDSWEKDGQKQTRFRISAERVSSLEMGQRGGADISESGDEGGYSGGGGGGGAARVAGGAAAGGAARAPQASRPSDNLDFPDNNVQDDIPF